MKQLCCAALLVATPVSAQSLTVSTPAGAIQGSVEGALRVFKGIPYAKPPAWTP
jgi:para-nitrobenzyl esterase